MRFSYAYLTIAVAAVVAACGPTPDATTKADTGTTVASADTSTLVPYSGPVRITLDCTGANAVEFSTNAFRVHVPRGQSVSWSYPGGGAGPESVQINPRASGAANWPLESSSITVPRGGNARSRRDKDAGPQAGDTIAYYTITGVCQRPGTNAPDTVVIDPIMILPK